jgi:hypothetical protein
LCVEKTTPAASFIVQGRKKMQQQIIQNDVVEQIG